MRTIDVRRTHVRRQVVIAMSLVLAASPIACTGEGAAAEPPGSSGPTTTVPEPLPVLFDEVPDDPALLGGCAEADDEVDRYTPASWLPATLPDGTTIRFASNRLPADVDVDVNVEPGWSSVLVATDSASQVTSAIRVTATFVQGGIDGEPPADRLRGVPGTIGASSSRGSGGNYEAMWVEDDVVWRVVAWGLDEAGLRAAIERGEFEPEGVSDPTGELTTLSWRPATSLAVTEIDLGERGSTRGRQDVVVVAEPVEGGGGPLLDGAGNAIGMQLGSIDGQPALRSESATTNGSGTDTPAISSLLTTTADGSPISVTGAFTMDELEGLVRSTERIEPDDDRLIGVPMTFPLDDANLAETSFCRTDR